MFPEPGSAAATSNTSKEPPPRVASPPVAALDRALPSVSIECRERVERALLGPGPGAPVPAMPSVCAAALREAVLLLAPRRAVRFGVVERRAVDLNGITLVLETARGCRRWPVRVAGLDILTPLAARAAQCRLERYEGSLPVFGFTEDAPGRPVEVATLDVREGIARLTYADLDRQSATRDASHPWKLTRLQLGDAAWAGQVDLTAVRDILGSYHFEWVARGRGAPGLFVAAHPDHARQGDAEALSFEASLSQQERDYLAVSRGEMAPAAFLDRHVWSPYRTSVAQMGNAAPQSDPR